MEVKIDDSHKKVNLRGLNLEKAKRLGIKLGATALTLFMLSGCQKKNDNTNNSEVEPSIQHEEVLDDEFVTTEDIIIPEEKTKKVFDIEEHSDDEVVGIKGLGHYFVTEDGKWLKKYDEDGNFISSTSGDDYYGRITYGDLKKIVECNITVNAEENIDYDFLNYMPNLRKINFGLYWDAEDANFDNVDGSRFKNSLTISFGQPDYSMGSYPIERGADLTRENFGFLEDIEDIETLKITGGVNFDSDFIQDLKQVHNLYLDLHKGFINFKYKDLKHLDSLTLVGGVYDIPMYFSNEDIEELENSGVVINYDSLEAVKKVNRQIDEIVAGLNLSDDASEQEKLNAILVYILTEYEYDSGISEKLDNGENVGKDVREFYDDGMLEAGLKGDTQICGNYAAMTYTLCKRLGLDVYNLASVDHYWNAVKIGDYYYYVDSTWLDGETVQTNWMKPDPNDPSQLIVVGRKSTKVEEVLAPDGDRNEIDDFNWYLEDPTEIDEIQTSSPESHVPMFIPSGLELKDVPEDVEDFVKYKTSRSEEKETENEFTELTTEQLEDLEDKDIKDISDKKFHVNINGKTVIIGAAAFVGILAGLGFGTLVHKKRVEERRRLRARQRELERQRNMNDMFKNTNRYNSNSYNNGGFRF